MATEKGKKKKEPLPEAGAQGKVVSLDELAGISARLRKEGLVVVHCHGVFDLMHPGHILYFEAAKKEGDILIVTLTEDKYVSQSKGPGRPVFNQDVRARTIASLSVVDYVAIDSNPTAVESILRLRPHVYAKGAEYADEKKDVTGNITKEREAIESAGGRIHFVNEPTLSSSELLNRHFSSQSPELKKYLDEFRKKYSGDDVISAMKKLEKLKVLVIGETIIDQYHYCLPMGRSAKESIVTFKFTREEEFAGGVLACANHTAGFVKEVRMLSCLGAENSREDFILKHLKSTVHPKFVYTEEAPTIVKRRYVWEPFLSKLFGVAFLDDRPVGEKTEKQMLALLDKELPKYDVVIVTDYGHGLFTDKIVKKLTEKAKFLAVNTQTNSANIGFNLVTKYPRADYVCIDDPEMRLAHHVRFGEIPDLIMKTAKQLKAKHVTVTRGHLGSLVWSAKKGFAETPVLSKEIVDRVGAGDAFLAVTAPCVAAGLPPELVGFIGNAVGALAVRIVGNRSAVEPAPLFKFITALLK